MITNTTEEVSRNPIVGLFAVMGGIEAQEARGQRELVASDVLPVVLQSQMHQYEALGFTFGAVTDGDPIFQHATFPKGWKRQGSDHSMWSYIVDDRGIKRVSIFYKAAFYDRSARMSLCNVGYELASDFIWGDEKEPVVPNNLTADEIAEAKRACETRERKDRAEQFMQALG